jgi:hypothetical protein
MICCGPDLIMFTDTAELWGKLRSLADGKKLYNQMIKGVHDIRNSGAVQQLRNTELCYRLSAHMISMEKKTSPIFNSEKLKMNLITHQCVHTPSKRTFLC